MAIECLKKKVAVIFGVKNAAGLFCQFIPPLVRFWSRDHKQLMSSTIGSFDYDQGNERRY